MGLNEHLEIQVRAAHISLSLLSHFSRGGAYPPLRQDDPKQVKSLGSKLFAEPFKNVEAATLGKPSPACPNVHCPDLGQLGKGMKSL